VPLAVVVLSVIALAFVFVLGTVVYGMVLGLVGWLGDLADQLRARVSPERPVNPPQGGAGAPSRAALRSAPPPAGDLPVFSADAMWERMQGTSSATSRKLRREARKR
jgi:hypothetical protein